MRNKSFFLIGVSSIALGLSSISAPVYAGFEWVPASPAAAPTVSVQPAPPAPAMPTTDVDSTVLPLPSAQKAQPSVQNAAPAQMKTLTVAPARQPLQTPPAQIDLSNEDLPLPEVKKTPSASSRVMNAVKPLIFWNDDSKDEVFEQEPQPIPAVTSEKTTSEPQPMILKTDPETKILDSAPLTPAMPTMRVEKIEAPEAPESAPAFAVIEGFGADIPLAIALQQVVPAETAFSFATTVNPGVRVSWEGGKPWNQVLEDMIAPAGLRARIDGKLVHISDGGNSIPGPVSALPEPLAQPAAAGQTQSEEKLSAVPSAPEIATEAPSEAAQSASAPPMKLSGEIPGMRSDQAAPDSSAESMNEASLRREFIRDPGAQAKAQPMLGKLENISPAAGDPAQAQALLPAPAAAKEPQAHELAALEPTAPGDDQMTDQILKPLLPVPAKESEKESTDKSVADIAEIDTNAALEISEPKTSEKEPMPLLAALPEVPEVKPIPPKTDPVNVAGQNLPDNKPAIWEAKKGDSLKDTLKKWSEQAKANFDWQARNDFNLPGDILISDTYAAAVRTIMSESLKDPTAPSIRFVARDGVVRVIVQDRAAAG